MDFKGATGTPIYSATDGVVQAAGVGQGYGNRVRVMIKTAKGDTLYMTYGHLSAIDAKEGQTVKRGDLIGKMGNTGQSTGTHLHFDVGFNGYAADQRVNPVPILGMNASNTECQAAASNCPAK
ncbi:M23 family metallopeptidase [Bacillus thuringiensis]|nr:M23 family metallopeptidase [Bacillus thuringiensis]